MCLSSLSAWRIPSSIICRSGLLVIIPFYVFLSCPVLTVLLHTVGWIDSYNFSKIGIHHFKPFLPLKFPWEVRSFRTALPLYLTWCFSLAAFGTLTVFCIFSVLTLIGVMWEVSFLVLSVDFLHTFYPLMCLTLPRFGKFNFLLWLYWEYFLGLCYKAFLCLLRPSFIYFYMILKKSCMYHLYIL